jgi:23S rRNA pseudouridine1911/1915/1917 synthase
VTARRTVSVPPDAPERADAFVRTLLPSASRRLVRALFDAGDVRVNGRPATKGTRVATGDVVELPLLEHLRPEPDLPLAIVYEDADLVALDKPGGVPGHALDPRERGTAAAALLARYPELAGIGDPLAPGLVHRLDTGTSGVLLAARTAAAWTGLRAAFRAHAVVKRYVAIVRGVPAAGLVVDAALAHDPGRRGRMRAARVGERAWPAVTRVVAVEPHGTRALVHVEIRTGVTHQVRAHLALAGHPVVGDSVYGGDELGFPPGRHALHAAALALPERHLVIEAPCPHDLLTLVA